MRIRIALAALLALLAVAPAAAQMPNIQDRAVWGRIGSPSADGGSGPSQAIPFSAFFTQVVNVVCSASPGTCAYAFGYYNIAWYSGIDSSGSTDNGPGLRAIADTLPDGAEVRVPQGTFKVSTCRNSAVIDMTGANANKAIRWVGVGWAHAGSGSTLQGSAFILDTSIPDTCDFYHQAPTAFVQGNIGFEDIGISPVGGVYTTPRGQHAFNFDGTANIGAYMEQVRIKDVFVDNMKTGYSVNINSQNGGTGLLANAVFDHNHFMNIHAANLGDQNKFLKNIIGANATNDSRNVGLYHYEVSGATNTIVRDNFFASATCIIDDGSLKSIYDGNTCEDIVTNSTGFMIWLKGSQYTVGSATISNNRISNLVAATTYVPIEIEIAVGTWVAGNYLSTPSLYSQIVSTAASSSTFVEASNITYVGASPQTDIAVGYSGSTNAIINSRSFSTWPLSADPGNPAIGYVIQFMNTSTGIPNWTKHDGTHLLPLAAYTCSAHQFATALANTGSTSCAQPALADLPTGTLDTALGYWGSTTASALAVNNCANALTYSTSTHTFGCNTLAGTGTVTTAGTGLTLTGGGSTLNVSLSSFTNFLSGDVAMSSANTYFVGPNTSSGAQSGLWFVTGQVSISNTAGDVAFCKMWDGTTVIASTPLSRLESTNTIAKQFPLSGTISSPAGNVRIECQANDTTSIMVFNKSGNSKDSGITMHRIQ